MCEEPFVLFFESGQLGFDEAKLYRTASIGHINAPYTVFYVLKKTERKMRKLNYFLVISVLILMTLSKYKAVEKWLFL